MIDVIIAEINTAPAETSLIISAVLWYSGLIKSTEFSTAVFIISSDNTKAMQISIIHHSALVIPKKTPEIIAKKATKSCILKFLCFKEILIPFTA